MKKIKFVFVSLLFLLCPFVVKADSVDPDYKVEAAFIGADLDITGSLHVREAYVVKGALNGFKREIIYKNSALGDWEPGEVDFSNSSIYNGRGLVLSKVSAFAIDGEDEMNWDIFNHEKVEFEEKSSLNKGDKGAYTKKDLPDGMEVSTYNVNRSGCMVYYYDYYVDQVAVMHNDVAELYYTLFKLDSDDVGEVNIQVTIPGSCTDDTFRFWAHGPLNGEIRGISESKDANGKYLYKGVNLYLKNYKAGELVEVRMTFDKKILNSFAKILDNSEQDALDKIVAIETKLADEANKKRAFMKTAYYGVTGVSIVYLVGLVALWIYMYLKYDKEHKSTFDHEYYREFIDDYNVEVVDYLMKKDITTNAMNASIMNLIYKKNIEIEEIPDTKKDVALILKSRDNINKTEGLLLELLFDTIGKEGRVTLKEIEKYSSKYSTAQVFMNKYNIWKNSALLDAKREGFYEDLNTPRACASIYFILGIIIFILFIVLNIESFVLMILTLLGAMAFIIYVWAFKKWSVKGREHYLKWNAFKKFLMDFGNFKDKEVPEVKLWDRYLVYATVFGIAKEVQKAMQVQLSNMDVDSNTMYTPVFTYRDFYVMNAISNSMSSAHTRCTTTINAEMAKSSSSSGGGFGGGFSGGGGFAGGGGGGGGF